MIQRPAGQKLIVDLQAPGVQRQQGDLDVIAVPDDVAHGPVIRLGRVDAGRINISRKGISLRPGVFAGFHDLDGGVATQGAGAEH